jgi:aquaporin Z
MAETLKETSLQTCGVENFGSCGLGFIESLVAHWPEYLIEAACMALFMFLGCLYTTLLQHPASPVHRVHLHPLFQRGVMGLAVGSTLAFIVSTPWGRQSGGHFNPAITLTYLSRLGADCAAKSEGE